MSPPLGGPDHHVQQHRDGRPPWCRLCRRHENGTPIDERPLSERLRGVPSEPL